MTTPSTLCALGSAEFGAQSRPDFLRKPRLIPPTKWNGLVFGDWNLFHAPACLLRHHHWWPLGHNDCLEIPNDYGNIRVSERVEDTGLDISENGESAYPRLTHGQLRGFTLSIHS